MAYMSIDIKSLAITKCITNKNLLTPARLLLLETLQQQKKPISAYAIQKLLKENNLSLNIATIYRVLDFWCHLGVVHKLSATNKFICCSSPDEKHTHIINSCQRCETVFESCNEQMGLNLKKGPESLGLTLVSNSHLEIPVICEACT